MIAIDTKISNWLREATTKRVKQNHVNGATNSDAKTAEHAGHVKFKDGDSFETDQAFQKRQRDFFDQLIQDGKSFASNLKKNKTPLLKANSHPTKRMIDCFAHVEEDAGKLLPINSSYLAALRAYSKKNDLGGIDAQTWAYLLWGVYAKAKTFEAECNTSNEQETITQINIDAILQQWAGFFNAYQQLEKKHYLWRGRILGMLYALSQGLVGGLAIYYVVVPAMVTMGLVVTPVFWVHLAIAASVGVLCCWTNYRLARVVMVDAWAQIYSAFSAIWYNTEHSLWRNKRGMILGGVLLSVCATVVMSILLFGGAIKLLPVAHGIAGPIAWAIAGIAGLFEILLLIKACVELIRQGGFSVIKRAFMQTMGISKHWGVQIVAAVFLALMLIANITGLALMAYGSMGDMQTFFGTSTLFAAYEKATYAAIAVCSSVGLMFFFIRSAMGWSYDVAKYLEMRHEVSAYFTRNRSKLLLRNTLRTLGFVAMVTLTFVPGAGFMMGLAVFVLSMVANVPLAALIDHWIKDKPPEARDGDNGAENAQEVAIPMMPMTAKSNNTLTASENPQAITDAMGAPGVSSGKLGDEHDEMLGMDVAATELPELPGNPTTLANGLANAAMMAVSLNDVLPASVPLALIVLTMSSMSNVHIDSMPEATVDDSLASEVMAQLNKVKGGTQ